MGRNARGPQIAQRVEFAEIAAHTQVLGKVVQLVLMAQAAQLHGLLVERRKADGVDLAGLGRVHAPVQHLQHRAPACGFGTTRVHGIGGHRVQGQEGGQGGVGAATCMGHAGDGCGGHLQARDALALLPQPGVAGQHDVGLLHGLGPRQQACDQFGAYAGGIAQGQGDDGKFGCGHVRLSRS